MPTIKSAIQKGEEMLTKAGVDSARVEAEWLLAHALNRPRLECLIDPTCPLSDQQSEGYLAMLDRRCRKEPSQYIIGTTEFMGLEFLSTPDALIPRPETEILANLAIKRAKSISAPVSLLDFGTGTGCLALSIASALKEARVTAVDNTEKALSLSKKNAEKLGLSERVSFVKAANYFEHQQKERFNLLVTNPPYIPRAEIEQLAPEIKDHEPLQALDGGTDGLSFYRLIAQQAPACLTPGAILLAEFGDGQGPLLQTLFQSSGWGKAILHADLTGRERILETTWGQSEAAS